MIPDTLKALAVPISSLRPYERNPRNGDLDAIKESLRHNQQYRPIVVNERDNRILAGNHTYFAAMELGWQEIAATFVDVDEEQAARIVLVDNRTNDLAQNDDALIAEILKDLPTVEGTGYTDDALSAIVAAQEEPLEIDLEEHSRSLSERFGVPPFSVLDARQGYWQARKRAWIALGIQSELGRGGGVTPGDSPEITESGLNYYRNRGNAPSQGVAPDGKNTRGPDKGKRFDHAKKASPGGSPQEAATLKDGKIQRGDGRGRPLNNGQDLMKGENENFAGRAYTSREWVNEKGIQGNAGGQSGTSIFDPVLCELAYRWFCPLNGLILDPFAGGSVRGIVAGKLGREYIGIDLRPEQVEANEEQARSIVPDAGPRWVTGDSRNLDSLVGNAEADFVFTCPPYFDLELYSEDPNDLSRAGDYERFKKDYRSIIEASVKKLKEDRFAAVVVGDIRDKKGFYRNFVSDTIAAFEDAGAGLYNEAILVTSVGSLPIRVGKQFESGRKLGKTHQNVLVFCKGAPRKATQAIGAVDFGDPLEEESDPAGEFGEALD